MSWDQALQLEVTSDSLRCFTLYKPQSGLQPTPPHPRGPLPLPSAPIHPTLREACLPSALCSRSAPSLPFHLYPVILKIASLLCLPINANVLLSANIISTSYLPPTRDRSCRPSKVGYSRISIVQRRGVQVMLQGDSQQSQALSLGFGTKPSTGSPAPCGPGPRGDPAKGHGWDKALAPAEQRGQPGSRLAVCFPKGPRPRPAGAQETSLLTAVCCAPGQQ